MPFGAEPAAGGIRFRLFAPDADAVSLCLDGPGPAREVPMDPEGDGWHRATVAEAGAGSLYRYRLDGGLLVPDPASRFQPAGVHGPSEVVVPEDYAWRDGDWRGRPWAETVLYELHVGAFTRTGTFAAVAERLDELADLGVTAIELMPVADFPGDRGWGYDGVCLFAPKARYGRPEDLKALVDAAHARGLMVFLDVVHNHLGPEGNYLHVCAGSRFFHRTRHTPWGAALNFDGPGSRVVRDWVIHNALFWLEEYHLDGLRLDAVDTIDDRSRPHILEELAAAVRDRLGADRHVHLVLENDHNQPRYLERDNDGRPRRYVAQWNDDIHHALHALLTGEDHGYYGDYADDPARHLARCLAEGFAYQGEPSAYRGGATRGGPSGHLPATAFVSFLQNHDQVGNRAFGERITDLVPAAAVEAAMAVLLLAPSPPLLFMGEDWAAPEPFLFFSDLGPDFRDPAAEGRRREFARFPEFRDPAARARIPDPAAPETFAASVLDHGAKARPPHDRRLAFTRELLDLRRRLVVPRLSGMGGGAGRVAWIAGAALMVTWRLGDGCALAVVANLSDGPSPPPPTTPKGRIVYATGPVAAPTDPLPPWSVAWYLDGPDAALG